MNINTKEATYSVSISGMLLLALFSATLLIAPNLLNDLGVRGWPLWKTLSLGGITYLVGTLSLLDVMLGYPARMQRWIYAMATVLLVTIGTLFFQTGLAVEAFWLFGLAVAQILSLRFSESDWMLLLGQSVNLLVSIAALTRPEWLELNMGNPGFPMTREALSLLFFTSAMIGMLRTWKPSLVPVSYTRLLAVPWLVWLFVAGLTTNVPQMLVGVSAAISLLWLRVIPWNQVVLREARAIARRFLDLILSGQSVGLVIILVLVFSAEYMIHVEWQALNQLRAVALVAYCSIGFISGLLIISLNLSFNGVLSGLNQQTNNLPTVDSSFGLLTFLSNSFLVPFTLSRDLVKQINRQKEEYQLLLAQQKLVEQRRMAQLNLLHQLNLELEAVLEPAVSAQLAANAMVTAMGADLCAIFENDSDRSLLTVVAASGPNAHQLTPRYQTDNRVGLWGRAGQTRKAQLVPDTRLESEQTSQSGVPALSELIVPILEHNQLKGAILLCHAQANAFDDSDIRTVETIALRLFSSWERNSHDKRLMRLIQSGVTLSTTLELESAMKQIAEMALQTLEARFVFMALLDKGGGFTRTASVGYAPTLLNMLASDPDGNSLIQNALNHPSPMRVRDVRKRFQTTQTDSNQLRSMISVPIRLRQSSIGVIMAFGKHKSRAFNENDESLASLLAGQASAAIETAWLYQELRGMFNVATQLHQLSTRIIQAEQLTDAAAAIAETTYQVIHAQAAGIVLQTTQQGVFTQVQMDENGLHPGLRHPMSLIKQAIESGQNIIVAGQSERITVCIPLQTPRHQHGVLWVEVDEKVWANARFSSNLHTLANQASIALERNILLTETLRQAEQLEQAYHTLENTYDQTLAALSSALDARDRETEGHSMRVAKMAAELGSMLGMDEAQVRLIERGSILHDIGKIGISDAILLKPGPLTPQEWHVMRQHPDIGARIIEGIPFLLDAMPIIRYHQERWDGSGYPIGLKGHEIPLMARMFAVVDTYDALTTDRPYRKKMPIEEALAYLNEKANVLFDPEVVVVFEQMIRQNHLKKPTIS